MLTLGIDSSGKTASAALVENGVVLGEYSVNIGLTHSQTLLPMVAALFEQTGRNAAELSLIAVSAGPGSFTGLRIGAATAKGLALSHGIPMAAVSTLEGLAFNLSSCEDYIHPIMDARRQQVYTAAYRNGQLVGEEEAVSVEALCARINAQPGRHVFLGDAVPVYREYLESHLTADHAYAQPVNLLQRAACIACLGEAMQARGEVCTSDALELRYVRKPQAEREREQQGLRDFELVHQEGAEKTKDKLAARNYIIGSGSGYENEAEENQ